MPRLARMRLAITRSLMVRETLLMEYRPEEPRL
jgi:hypothetical protein